MSADCWVPVPVRFRHLTSADVFVGRHGDLWMVSGVGPDGDQFRIDVVRGYVGPITHYVDPDDVVQVLVPVTEREAVELARTELGARLVERRTG